MRVLLVLLVALWASDAAVSDSPSGKSPSLQHCFAAFDAID
jgi:hypothetical protein